MVDTVVVVSADSRAMEPGPLQRLESVKRDANALNVIAQRVAGGETMPSICKAWEIPLGATLAWLIEDEGRFATYRRALVASGFADADEAKDIADATEGAENGAKVAAAKLRAETRRWRASKHAAEFFGERVELAVTRSLPSEEALMAKLDALIAARPGLLDALLERRERLAQTVTGLPAEVPMPQAG